MSLKSVTAVFFSLCSFHCLCVSADLTMGKESLPSWAHRDSDEGLVHVNVGGLKRSLCSSTLKKFPDTRLGKLLACDSEEAILQVFGCERDTTDTRPNGFLLDLLKAHLLLFFFTLPLSYSHLSCYRCVMTMMCRRRSFTLIGIPACSLTSSTSTKLANFTSWRSCASSPSGLSEQHSF